MGLTATPERTDNFDIYQFFDYNIAYEIRFMKLCGKIYYVLFHYFGIRFEINGNSINNKVNINMLTSDERVKHILEKSGSTWLSSGE